MKSLEEINEELELLAQQELEERIAFQYEEFMNEMYQLWALEQYASDCADMDAEFYGEMNV